MIIEIITAGIILLLLFYSYFLSGILRGLKTLIEESYGVKDNSLPDDYISIIIPFRNESQNILETLSSLEKQDYSKDKFEVIFVNDFSDDDSLELLCKAEKSLNIKIISLPEDYSKYQIGSRITLRINSRLFS